MECRLGPREVRGAEQWIDQLQVTPLQRDRALAVEAVQPNLREEKSEQEASGDKRSGKCRVCEGSFKAAPPRG